MSELLYKERKKRAKKIDLSKLEKPHKELYKPDHRYHHGHFYPQCQECVKREAEEQVNGAYDLFLIGKVLGHIPKDAKFEWGI